MKKLFFMSLCLAISTSWGQNWSRGGVSATLNTSTSLPAVSTATTTGVLPPLTEAFRFQPGLITQPDSGTNFNFTQNDRWFSLGRLDLGPTSLYGFRLQKAG